MLPATACTNIHMGGGFVQALGVPNVRDFFGHHFSPGFPQGIGQKSGQIEDTISIWASKQRINAVNKSCLIPLMAHTSFENCNIVFLCTFA